MKCSGENVILRGIVHAVSGFPLHFMLNRGNLDCFSNRVHYSTLCTVQKSKTKFFEIDEGAKEKVFCFGIFSLQHPVH